MSQMPTSMRVAAGRSTSRAVKPDMQTPHVLVADADPESRLQREQHLRARGVSVLVARTGFEAIVKASCQMPDLIVLDESLGPTEVHETARLLTTCPVTAQTPVLCLPARRRIPVRVLARLRRRMPT